MLVLVHARRVDAKPRVGQPPRDSRVGQVTVDENGGEEREGEGPSESAAAEVGVVGPDYAVGVAVPVRDVLNYDLRI